MTWHECAPCDHDCEAKCVKCGLKVGYKWVSDHEVEPGICSWCDAALRSLGIGELTTKDGVERRGEARFVARDTKPMVLDQVRREDRAVLGRLRVGRAEAAVTLGPDGYTGRIEVDGYPMMVVIDPKAWGVKFLN